MAGHSISRGLATSRAGFMAGHGAAGKVGDSTLMNFAEGRISGATSRFLPGRFGREKAPKPPDCAFWTKKSGTEICI